MPVTHGVAGSSPVQSALFADCLSIMRFIVLFFLLLFFYSCKDKKNEEVLLENKDSVSCTFSRNEKDALGRRVKMYEEQKFISKDTLSSGTTYPVEFFKGYLSCISVDTTIGVFFSFKIHAEDAYEKYGMITKGNNITFRLKSGKMILLPFGATFSGNTDLSKDMTEYLTFAYLPSRSSEILKNDEIEEVIITWSKKTEKYPVVYPRIFTNQLSCIVK